MSASLDAEALRKLVAAVFAASGSAAAEAGLLADHLVEANLVGHDSHGVIRVAKYLDWLRHGQVCANRHARLVDERGPILIVDGDLGYGQIVAREAMALAAAAARRHGIAVLAIRNTGHLGRIGAWPEQLAAAGLVSLHLVNTSGFGILVAPFGGSDRRLSANPIAAGVPVKDGPPILLDMSCCTIAEGKLKVAFNKGVNVPEDSIIDSKGQPTTDPKVFYGDPPGAILSIAGHKGYGLGIITEMLAGALTGGGASNPANAGRLANGMLSIYMDPNAFQEEATFAAEVHRFIEWVKSSEKTQPNGEIYMPGEIEEKTKAARLQGGIELDDTTWKSITDVCRSLEVPVEKV